MKQKKNNGFMSNVGGTIAPLFALLAVAILLVTGIAIDGSRAYHASTKVAMAIDAAAMAAAKELRHNSLITDSDLEALAKKYFDANLQNSGGVGVVYDQLTLNSNRVEGSVTLNVDTRLPTTFGRLMSTSEIALPKTATAIDESKDVELSMMLDLSGSMGGSKISALQVAANGLVDILLGANEIGAKNRIAIAPYASAVNVGSYSGPATGILDSNTCVTERPGAGAFKDKGPGGGLLKKKSTDCPASEIVPLTDDEPKLTGHISAMTPGGWTAGHLGIAWSWYLISPEWASFWPAESEPKPYSDPRVMKVAIIMTDGEFNTSYEAENGNSKTQAEKLCDGMKAAGITIYTVSFQAPVTALPILQYCASSTNHFFDAQSADGLLQSFQEIAKSLSALRLAG